MAYGIKTGGRTKGTPNKVSLEMRESLSRFVVEYEASGLLGEDLNSVSPETRLRFHLECAKIVTGNRHTLLLNN